MCMSILSVHIFKDGHETTCRAILNNGSIRYYNWDSYHNRALVRSLANPDTIINVDSNVMKGWEYE